MQGARDARTAAIKALSAKIKELAAADPSTAALATRGEALDKEYAELKAKARESGKKSSK